MIKIFAILALAAVCLAVEAEMSDARGDSHERTGVLEFDETSTDASYLWTKSLILRCVLVELSGRKDKESRSELIRTKQVLRRVEVRLQLIRGDLRNAQPPVRRGRPAGQLLRENTYDHLILRAAGREGLHPALFKALIRAESAFNPHARSKVGALGLCQLMPQNIRRLGVRDPFDPEQNIRAGARMLAELLAGYGSVRVALVAWNAGSEYARGHKPLPKETKRLLRVVNKWFHIYKIEMSETEPGGSRLARRP